LNVQQQESSLDYLPYKEISEDATLGKALALFENSIDILVVLNKKSEYTGILQERQILRTDLDPSKSKVRSFKSGAPKIKRSTQLQECARLMVENNIMYLPVFEKGKISGIMSYTNILRSPLLKKLAKHAIKDILTTSMTIASPEDKLATVYNKFRKSDIYSLPVVEDGKFLGTVYLHDTLHTIIQHRDKPHFGSKLGEKQHLLDLPIRNIMTRQSAAMPETAQLGDVIDKIIDDKLDCISIIDSDNSLRAIMCVKELLKLVTEEEQIMLVPKINIKADFDNLNRNSVNITMNEFVKKYSSILSQAEVEVFLKEHKEKHRDQKLIYSRIQIHAHKEKFDASGEGWGVDHSMRETLNKLERQIRRLKTTRKHGGKK
jgi:predicted transcriptional regulator/ribosome-associated translation inhibitor RaiA